MEKFDIIVVGGGVAGTMAAVSAARNGASVLLIEREGYLGGTMTACGTSPMMTFHAGEKQVIRGAIDELVQRLKAKRLSPGHIPDSTGYTYTVTPFDSEGFKRELELMATEAGVHLLFHANVIGSEKAAGLLRSVEVFCCAQRLHFAADIFIDASGDADLIAMTGIPWERGRKQDGKDQPLTTNFTVDHVDIAAIRQLMHTDLSLFPRLISCPEREAAAARLSCLGFKEQLAEAVRAGELTYDQDTVLFFETNRPGEVNVNMTHVNGLSPVDPFEFSKAEIEGRRQCWETFRFLQKRIPGFENARMLTSGPRIGVRSFRRMIGRYVLHAEGILNETVFEDAIAANGYPIDIHSIEGQADTTRRLRDGGWYTIPYRCLINDQLPNVMAAGRNISCSFRAQASTRLSPICGAVGQAAGTAAALCKKASCLPTELDYASLRETLLAQQAFLGN